MPVPSYEALMRPTLEALAEQGDQRLRDLVELVADRVGLTSEDRAATIASGGTVVTNRVGWAVTYLVQAGAVGRPRRGVASITDRGRQLLGEVEGPVSNAHLSQYPEFNDFRRRARGTRRGDLATTPTLPQPPEEASDSVAEESNLSPTEVIEQTVASVHIALASELLDRVMDLSPVAFERLVLRLLGAMGYGASGQIESTAESGDAGIDGVISQDPLGLDRIYVQAKRYARDRTIGRPAMQAFVGALQGQQADRGVFMTTCSFTGEALTYADRVGVRIIPIGGTELADLMLEHNVGVQPRFVTTLLRLDEDFFEGL